MRRPGRAEGPDEVVRESRGSQAAKDREVDEQEGEPHREDSVGDHASPRQRARVADRFRLRGAWRGCRLVFVQPVTATSILAVISLMGKVYRVPEIQSSNYVDICGEFCMERRKCKVIDLAPRLRACATRAEMIAEIVVLLTDAPEDVVRTFLDMARQRVPRG